jgi:uncharacterized protein YndB with AHSA1/START domain
MKTNDQPGQFTGPAEVRIIRTLPGPIERIWEYLTDSEKRARWFAGGPMEQRPAGKVQLVFRHADLAPGEAQPAPCKEGDESCDCTGRVTRCEPPRVLAYTFGSTGESEVTFELTPEGKNVRLVLTHRSHGSDVPYLTGFGAGWHTHLAHLIAELEGTPHPPFWSLHAKLRVEYENLRVAEKLS